MSRVRTSRTSPRPRPLASLSRATLERELRYERRVTKALSVVGLATGAALATDELIDLVLAKVAGAVEADRAMFFLLDAERTQLRGRVLDEQGRLRPIDLPPGKGIVREAIHRGESVLATGVGGLEADAVVAFRGTGSSIATPITRHDGEVVGAVELFRRSGKKAFDEEARGILTALATQVGVALENAFLVASLRKQAGELAEAKAEIERQLEDRGLSLELERAMARAPSKEELVRVVLGQALRSARAELAALALEDEELGQHVLWVLVEADRRLRTYDLRPGQGLIGSVVEAQATIVADRSDDPRSDVSLDEAVGVRTRNAIACPVEGSVEGHCIGALAVYNKVGARRFDRHDVATMELLAANASTALRLRLAGDGKERDERLATIGGLLSGILHDMRTPLAVVRGSLDLIATEERAAERKDRAKKAKLQLDALGRMEADVLSFVRGEATVLVRKVYLDAFVEGLRDDLAPWLARRNIKFSVETHDHGVHRFDEAKIARVLQNLVRNAAEAIGSRGGAIALSARRDPAGAVVFAVRDDGPGIPVEIRARLFGTFVSAGKSGGTGLGLAMAKRFVDEHRGVIDYDTGRAGTTFRVVLPAPDPSLPGVPSIPPR